MSIPEQLSIQITRLPDGGIQVQELHPEGPLADFMGRQLTQLQVAQVGVALLNGSGIWGDFYPSRPPRVENEPGYGFVYLASDGTMHKIGRSGDPKGRVLALGRQAGREIRLVHLFDCDDCTVAEVELHRRYAAFRVHGEWFNLSPEHVAEVMSIVRYRAGIFVAAPKP
jgi:hypothetical protein